MGWNVTYPSNPQDERYFDDSTVVGCEGHHCQNNIEQDEAARCMHEGCERDWLCDGCTYVCGGPCGRTFCKSHIIEHPTEQFRQSRYICQACEAQKGRVAA